MKNNIFSVLSLVMLMLITISCNKDNASVENQTTQQTTRTHPAQKVKPTDSKKADNANNNLNWLTFEQAAKLGNKGSKKYLVDVYTNWCGWCKVMDKQTFSDPTIQAYLEDNFHVIKFNAEQKESIDFKGKSYEWIPAGRRGVNMLAMELLGSRLSYPTLVYLDENMNKIRSSPGFKKPDQLISELKVITGS